MKKGLFSIFLFLSCLFSTYAENLGFVAEYGRLKLVGNQLSSEKGDAIQLKGLCTGVIGEDACLYRSSFKTMKEWGLSSVRLNYSPYTHSKTNVARLKSYIDICAEQGLYAIVDWHIFESDNHTNTGNPSDYADDAKDFFETISAYVKEKGYIHVIYDICNEPSGVNWKGIKEYAEEILPIIETNDPGAIVIIGTRDWCQKIIEPVSNPINAKDYNLGIMYSFNYYACSHYALLGDLRSAMKAIPVYVSEWTSGRFDYSNETVCESESEDLLSTLAGTVTGQLVSWNYWSWGNTGIWKNCEDGVYKENLTETGKYLVNLLNVTLDSKPAESEYVANFKEYGRLKLVGNQLSSEKGDAIQLKGINTGVIGEDACLYRSSFKTMKEWGLSSVRLNYSPYTHSEENVARLKSYIDICAELGLYAIVDWHIVESDDHTNKGNPSDYADEAKDFFETISAYVKEKGYNHVIYDICNEPSGVNWKEIKGYAEEILPIIETNDPGAIVIVGTADWCQKIIEPVVNPINANDYNLGIMYSFHYYACSHYSLLGDLRASVKSIPVFVSEWTSGRFDYSNETACETESDYILSTLDPVIAGDQIVSWNYWSWGNTGIWKNCADGIYKENLTETGKYFVNLLNVSLESKPAESEYVANFKEYGRLKLVGRQLCSEKGDTIQLKGVCTGVIGEDACLDKNTFKTMKEWGLSSVRLNYSPYTHSEENVARLKSYIDICAELGLYAIVDWHIFEHMGNSGDPMDFIKEATEFFEEISTYVKEKGYMHVLYDICNEPSKVKWEKIKEYAEEILPIIETNDPGAIVIVGTSFWCQNIKEPIANPINAHDYNLGIMYSFHYFACSHYNLLGDLRTSVKSIPVFVSNWTSGRFDLDTDFACDLNSDDMLAILDAGTTNGQIVSWCYWSWGNTGIWKNCGDGIYKENLTGTGNYLVKLLNVTLDSKPVVSEYVVNFKEYGRLKLVGRQLCSEKGDTVQLKGFNTGVIGNDIYECLDRGAFQTMKEWGCKSVRLNYSPYTNSSNNLMKIKSYIDVCAEFGLYAIVDWHIFEEGKNRSGDPNDYIDDATAFFGAISSYVKEKGYMHVLYDICNEPSGTDWKSIKNYAAEILHIIESNDPGAIVIIGTADWSKQIYEASLSPIRAKDYDLGIMYSFHYSACSHADLLANLKSALVSVPVFISDWSCSDYTYQPDKVCETESNLLLNIISKYGNVAVSWNYWAWAGETGIWKNCGNRKYKEDLTKTGEFITNLMNVNLKSKPIVYKWEENFAEFGRLNAQSGHDFALCSESGKVVQLKGFNTGIIDEEVSACLSKEAFQTMKDWGCSSVRLNYSPYTHSDEKMELIKSYIDICGEVGLYAIVDWHILGDNETRSGNPNDYIDDAKSFFSAISSFVKEEKYMHVLYDICNEPSGVDWKSIKNYATEILPVIESNDPGAIVIVGTPNWCQKILDPVNNEIDEKEYNLGIMYSFHYSACDHVNLVDDLRQAMKYYPMFISEWTSSNSKYDIDEVCSENALKLLINLDNNHQIVSWNYWAWAGETGIWKECGNNYHKDNLNKIGSYILVDVDEFNYPYKSESLVDDFDNDRFVEVVPNPANESFSVRFKGNANVCIYNTTGQKVLEKEASNVLNVNENLTSGIYNIVVRGEDYVENIKLIVK
ncbi:MAG: cellulase family glycosylhydrolase [Paludibacteraceae bacterium]|nr:cellulase family glycosylhydrolase [Paludibacteraceae bacterium]